MAINPKFQLEKGVYSLNFIRALAMAAHLGLIQPSELTFMVESGKTEDHIAKELLTRVVQYRKTKNSV